MDSTTDGSDLMDATRSTGTLAGGGGRGGMRAEPTLHVVKRGREEPARATLQHGLFLGHLSGNDRRDKILCLRSDATHR